MKKILYSILAVAALSLAFSCGKDNQKDKEDPEEEVTLEINEANLKGIWEVDIEHDFAQGYHRKYRISFDGKGYTLWVMHQDALKLDKNSQEFTLCDVGNKYKGSWTYLAGSLTLSNEQGWASYQQKYDTWDDYSVGKFYYEVMPYSVETMEADPWIELMGTASELWSGISLTKNTLKARINMDSVTFARKE